MAPFPWWVQPQLHLYAQAASQPSVVAPAVPVSDPCNAMSAMATNEAKGKGKNRKGKGKGKKFNGAKNANSNSNVTSEAVNPADGIEWEDECAERKFRGSIARKLSDTAPFKMFVVSEALSSDRCELHASVCSFLSLDADHHGLARSSWPALIVSACPELETLELDFMLVSLVMMCRRSRSAGHAVHDFIEYSAGSATLTMQCIFNGLDGVALDKSFMIDHDNTTAAGLRLWINEMAVTKPGSLNWFGTQCSSFSAMCKNNSQRWETNRFLGNLSVAFVRAGNHQMVVTALLMLISYWCSNVPVLEQPMNSSMPKCPPLLTVLKFVEATRVLTWHKAFGSASMKPLQIISSSNIIEALRRSKPKGKSASLAKHGDDGRYSGIKKRMESSQAYTPLFGLAVAEMMKQSFGCSR